jgi:DNA modification methylase
MEKHLQWRGVVSDVFGSPNQGIPGTKVANSWYAILAFSKGNPTGPFLPNRIHAGGREKDAHEWQKSLIDVEYLIEKLTDQGALVVDPFTGAATVPTACKKLGRRWLACEIDRDTARIARGRIAA